MDNKVCPICNGKKRLEQVNGCVHTEYNCPLCNPNDIPRCQSIVEWNNGIYMVSDKCNNPAKYIIEYPESVPKLVCGVHKNPYEAKAKKFGWALPIKISEE